MLVCSDNSLGLPSLDKYLIEKHTKEVLMKKSFQYKFDSDDCSINSDDTEETTTSTISNDSFGSEVTENQDCILSEDSNGKMKGKVERDSEIEALALMFESGNLSTNTLHSENKIKLLSLEGLSNTCALLQNILFEAVYSGYFLFKIIRSSGELVGSSKNSKKHPEEMEIQFVYVVIDGNGNKRIVKSPKKLNFPPCHQMPGCCLKDKLMQFNEMQSGSTIEISDLSFENLSCISSRTSTKKIPSSSLRDRLRSIFTQVPLTLFQKRSSCKGKSSVVRDDDMPLLEEIEIQFVDY